MRALMWNPAACGCSAAARTSKWRTALFEHVHRGVRLKAVGAQDVIDKVVVDDNVFSDDDYGAVDLEDGTIYSGLEPPMGRLYDVRVLRNKFDHIGLRPDLFGQGEAIEVDYAETAEVAGNICRPRLRTGH